VKLSERNEVFILKFNILTKSLPNPRYDAEIFNPEGERTWKKEDVKDSGAYEVFSVVCSASFLCRKIREFTDQDALNGHSSNAGEREIEWDMTNESGSGVANGVYILRLAATGLRTHKTVELKTKVVVVK